MRYTQPERDLDQNSDDDEVYFEGRPRYVSDQTAFMRWSTELEQVDNIIDKQFLKDNRHRVIDINKILPLSFIEDKKSIKLFRLRRMNIGRSMDAGLVDLAEETVLDNLADYQTTRGIRGNYQKALITTRREWKDRSNEEKKQGIISRLISNGRENDRNDAFMEE